MIFGLAAGITFLPRESLAPIGNRELVLVAGAMGQTVPSSHLPGALVQRKVVEYAGDHRIFDPFNILLVWSLGPRPRHQAHHNLLLPGLLQIMDEARPPAGRHGVPSPSLMHGDDLTDAPRFHRMEPPQKTDIPVETFKKFSPPKEVISEPAMAEGFCWKPKQPARPGQFSERPQPKTSKVPLIPEDAQADAPPPHGDRGGIKAHVRGLQPVPEIRPLELPGLNFDLPKENIPRPVEDARGPPPRNFPESPRQAPGNIANESQITPNHGPGTASAYFANKDFSAHDSPKKQHGGHIPRESHLTARSPAKTASSTTPEVAKRKSHGRDSTPHRRRAPGHSRRVIPMFPPEESRRHWSPDNSVCGDLEGLPVRHHRHHQSPRHPVASSVVSSLEANLHRNGSPCSPQRPQSRNSNISRKRSSIQKPRSGTDTERKRMLMESVARHWNECLEIAEAEKQNALDEIIYLKAKISQKAKDLKDAEAALSRQKAQMDEMETRCRDTAGQKSEVSQANESLTTEAETLRKSLCESKERESRLGEKYKTYKDKINEAIGEQQELYKRSRSYYENLLHELEEEKNTRDQRAGEVDEALKKSIQKRAEMKRVFDEWQEKTKEETQRSKS